ncbi:MAG: hypothetical protein ABI406_08275 [Ktedonobacteraceae bacterium]
MATKMPEFCHMCGQRLVGTFLTYDNGLVVCSRCNATVPHCSLCGIPSQQLISVRGVRVCLACRQKMPVCACCGIPILKEYTIVGDSSAPYCETCMTTRPRCDICRAPINDKGKIIPGRGGNTCRCVTCYSTAVTTANEAERLYQETRALLRRELKLDIPVLPELHVVERAKLAALNAQSPVSGNAEVPLGPENQHLLGFFQRNDENRAIYIEQVLPRALFQAVAAHELAHAWQSFNAPPTQPLKIVEGFAEWVSYRILLALGQQREAARLTRRSDLYGEGLHYFIDLERKHGRNGVLQRAVQ